MWQKSSHVVPINIAVTLYLTCHSHFSSVFHIFSMEIYTKTIFHLYVHIFLFRLTKVLPFLSLLVVFESDEQSECGKKRQIVTEIYVYHVLEDLILCSTNIRRPYLQIQFEFIHYSQNTFTHAPYCS